MKLLDNYINKRSLKIDSNIVVNENLKPMYYIKYSTDNVPRYQGCKHYNNVIFDKKNNLNIM